MMVELAKLAKEFRANVNLTCILGTNYCKSFSCDLFPPGFGSRSMVDCLVAHGIWPLNIEHILSDDPSLKRVNRLLVCFV